MGLHFDMLSPVNETGPMQQDMSCPYMILSHECMTAGNLSHGRP